MFTLGTFDFLASTVSVALSLRFLPRVAFSFATGGRLSNFFTGFLAATGFFTAFALGALAALAFAGFPFAFGADFLAFLGADFLDALAILNSRFRLKKDAQKYRVKPKTKK
jgi:hypothetical protein